MSDDRVLFSLVVIRVADLERAQRFYNAIGLRFSRERHGNGPEHLAAELDGVVFEIYPVQDSSTTGTRFGFRVTSVDATVSVLKQLAAEVAQPPKRGPWGMRAVVVDPDGHRVELTEHSQ